eukprot:7825020-Alexandrium_andersonii.AAC.1
MSVGCSGMACKARPQFVPRPTGGSTHVVVAFALPASLVLPSRPPPKPAPASLGAISACRATSSSSPG